MFISCPLCGDRDIREFTYKGDAAYLARPTAQDWSPEWDEYLHTRDNPAGPTRELWYHGGGCGAWLVVERDTTTHTIISTRLATEDRP